MLQTPFYARVWFWVLIVVVVFGVIGGSSDTNESTKSSNTDVAVNSTNNTDTTQEIKENPVEEVITISAEELAKAFEDNEINANKLYKDKMLEITGTVYDIGEMLGSTYIVLAANEEFAITQTQCSFKDEEQISKVAELSKGDTVTVIGKCDGKSINVGVNECKFK